MRASLSGFRSLLVPTASILLAAVLGAGCASGPDVKKSAYAELKTSRVLEHEFPAVWKGVESALSKHKIVDRDPEEVDEVELKKLTQRTATTDWIYTESRDKYVEYKINGSPRRKNLQIRVKYDVEVEKRIGGTEVRVVATEELEKLDENGEGQGYSSSKPDSARAAELLDRIQNAVLAAPNL